MKGGRKETMKGVRKEGRNEEKRSKGDGKREGQKNWVILSQRQH